MISVQVLHLYEPVNLNHGNMPSNRLHVPEQCVTYKYKIFWCGHRNLEIYFLSGYVEHELPRRDVSLGRVTSQPETDQEFLAYKRLH